MLNRAPCKTPRQRAAFKRRVEAMKLRRQQRWGYGFRDFMRWRSHNRQIMSIGLKAFILRLAS